MKKTTWKDKKGALSRVVGSIVFCRSSSSFSSSSSSSSWCRRSVHLFIENWYSIWRRNEDIVVRRPH